MSIFARLRDDAVGTGRAVLDAVYPARCVCNPDLPLATRPPFGLCETCVAGLDANDGSRCPVCDHPGRVCCEPFGVHMRAPYLYGGVLARAIAAMKFEGRDDLARGLGRLLAEQADIQALAGTCGICVPVPLYPARARARGYNQSAILARMVGRGTNVPVRYWLRRVRSTPPQHLLKNDQRRRNLIGAFAAKGRVTGSVLLVDDVITSGETVRAAARALLDAGAREVVAIALARTERDILSADALRP